jgi:hypothetical protein
MTNDPDRLLKLGIVAKELHLPQRLVKKMILGGAGPDAIVVGRGWVRVKRSSLDRYKAQQAASPAPAADAQS